MDTAPHLATVPPDGNDPNPKRGPSRSRPKRSLMTDRLKFDVSERTLTTLARLSGPNRAGVTAARLGDSLGISPDSAKLPMSFFIDAGWVEKPDRSTFAATEALLDFTRKQASGMPAADAKRPLTATMKQSWYWQAVAPVLHLGKAPKSDVVSTLMQEAGASPHHLPMVDNVILWMQWAGVLVLHTDGSVGTLVAEPEMFSPDPDPAPAPKRDAPAADPQVSKPTGSQDTENPVVVRVELAFTIDQWLALTAPEGEAVLTCLRLMREGQ